MIKFEHTEVFGFNPAIRGMRNPMNSWDKSDSVFPYNCYEVQKNCDYSCPLHREYGVHDDKCDFMGWNLAFIGPNDHKLMMDLRSAGSDHRKYLRMIVVYVDITAPLYWWKEFKTYRAGRKFGDDEPSLIPDEYLEYDIEMNSCSTMHRIAKKNFDRDDFSHDHIPFGSDAYSDTWDIKTSGMYFCVNEEDEIYWSSEDILDYTIMALNHYRKKYLETKDKKYWWQMIQLLPSSYNQKRTVMMTYEVLANIYRSRKNHKLDEWSIGFINWIKSLPYSELITGSKVINDAQNALKGSKFADTATFEENEGICKGKDKNSADALFDAIYGLNVSWFKNDEPFPEHYKKAISKLNEGFKDKNNGKK